MIVLPSFGLVICEFTTTCRSKMYYSAVHIFIMGYKMAWSIHSLYGDKLTDNMNWIQHADQENIYFNSVFLPIKGKKYFFPYCATVSVAQ